ncbi:MAG: hypothetical protein ACRDG5_08090 [Anaerolineales bacterium]
MAFKARVWWAISVFAVAALSCSVLQGLPGIGGGGGSSDVLFEDDFSDDGSGWDRVDESDRVTDYRNGSYVIRVNDTSSDAWANPGKSFTDVRVEVDATKADGDDNNNFGVICRSEGVDDFYTLWISSDGFWAIVKIENGDLDFLADWETHDAIRQGDATNHIRADCVGDELTLYANGTLLGSASDSAYSSGDVGLEAGTFDVPGTEIQFDNFVVYAP